MALAAQTFAVLKAQLDARVCGRVVAIDAAALATGVPELDRALGGGFIRGSIACVEGPPSSGRTTLLASVLRRATKNSLAAAIDEGALYPPDLERAGVELERLFIVSAHSALAVARCADVLLRSRAFSVIAMPSVRARAAIWSRLAALAQKSGSLLLAHGARTGNELGFFASTRLQCRLKNVQWAGQGYLSALHGYEFAADVLKHRRSGALRSA